MSAQPIIARAWPKQITITEHYKSEIDVDLSVDAWQIGGESSQGKIEIITPYDGYEYFTREAIADVKKQSTRSRQFYKVRIGHLLFKNHQQTSLLEMLDGGNHHFVQATAERANLQSLMSDEQASHTLISYEVPKLPVPPIKVHVDIFDEDALSYKRYQPDKKAREPDEIRTFMRRTSPPTRELTIVFRITVEIPYQLSSDEEMLIEKMTLNWPMATSYSPADLKITARPRELTIPTTYSPEKAGEISWSDIPLRKGNTIKGRRVVVYSADLIALTIHNPAELYRQTELEGEIKVTVPALLSKLHLEYFDALGNSDPTVPIIKTSRLGAKITINLSRYFKQRLFTPYQLLQFRNVVLDEMRVDDVKAVLTDLNFHFREEDLTEQENANSRQQNLLSATQPYRASELRLWILMEGTPSSTTRQRELDGGVTLTTPYATGHTTFYIWGELEQDNEYVLATINKIHLRLKERFEHVGIAE